MLTRRTVIFLLVFLLVCPGFAAGVQRGQKLYPFVHKDLNGNLIDMKEIVGKKPVMLVFWASWCPNCKTEAPKVNELVKKYRDQGMEFIGINIGFNDSMRRARSFVKKTQMAYPTIFDDTHAITQRYMIQGVPTILVADSKGIVQFRNFGTPEITEENFQLLMGNN